MYGVYRLSDRNGFSARFRAGSNFPVPGYYEARIPLAGASGGPKQDFLSSTQQRFASACLQPARTSARTARSTGSPHPPDGLRRSTNPGRARECARTAALASTPSHIRCSGCSKHDVSVHSVGRIVFRSSADTADLKVGTTPVFGSP